MPLPAVPMVIPSQGGGDTAAQAGAVSSAAASASPSTASPSTAAAVVPLFLHGEALNVSGLQQLLAGIKSPSVVTVVGVRGTGCSTIASMLCAGPAGLTSIEGCKRFSESGNATTSSSARVSFSPEQIVVIDVEADATAAFALASSVSQVVVYVFDQGQPRTCTKRLC